jgi:hypothetical protein
MSILQLEGSLTVFAKHSKMSLDIVSKIWRSINIIGPVILIMQM